MTQNSSSTSADRASEPAEGADERNPFDNPETPEQSARRQWAADAADKRAALRAAYGDLLVPVDALEAPDVRNTLWGKALTALVAYRTKEAGRANKPAPDVFPLRDLFDAGKNGVHRISDERVIDGTVERVVAALPTLSPAEWRAREAARDYEFQVCERVKSKRVERDAQRRLAAEDAVAAGDRLEFTSLTDMLSEPDVDEPYVIDQLLSESGKVLLAAQYKAGKTTMVANLLRSLADGTPFLGRFAVAPGPRRIALIDNEMSRPMLGRWLRRQGIVNTDSIHPVTMRGRAGEFDLLTPHGRAEWAKRLRGFDVVVFDCLRPVLDALGLSEDKDAGRFLVQFDATMHAAGVRQSIVVHHMGHNGERARGDSALLGWSETNWRLIRRGDESDGDRLFTAFGRDSEVPPGLLRLDPDTAHLVYLDEATRAAETDPAEREALAAMVRHVRARHAAGAPANKSQCELFLRTNGLAMEKARALLERAVSDGALVTTGGGGRGKQTLYHPPTDPHAPPEVQAFEYPAALEEKVERQQIDHATEVQQKRREANQARIAAEDEAQIEQAAAILREIGVDGLALTAAKRKARGRDAGLKYKNIEAAYERAKAANT